MARVLRYNNGMNSASLNAVPSLDEAVAFSPQQIVELVRSQVMLRQEVQTLKHQLDWFKRQIFGQKSERCQQRM